MRLSKTNSLFGGIANLDFSLAQGSDTNGDFGQFCRLQGTTTVAISISATNGQDPTNYVCFHNFRLDTNQGAAPDQVTIKVYDSSDNTGPVIYNETVNRNPRTLFFVRDELKTTGWYVEFTRTDGAALPLTLYISCLRAGEYLDWPRGGLRGGEYLPHLGNNKQTYTTTNEKGQPVARTVKNISKQTTIKCPDADAGFVDDLRDVFDAYNDEGIISIQMLDNDFNSGFCGFDMQDTVNVHPQTRSLVSVSLTMKTKV